MSNLQNNTTELQSILDAVNALPDAVDTSGVTATDGHVLAGDKFVDATGALVDGSMPNNGAISQTMDGVNTKSVTVPAGYTSGGSVSLDSTIDNAVAAMKTALTDKGVTVPSDADALDIASLIAAIEAGGGSELKAATGSFTPSENTNLYTVTHNLGVIPKIVLLVLYSETTIGNTYNLGHCAISCTPVCEWAVRYTENATRKIRGYTYSQNLGDFTRSQAGLNDGPVSAATTSTIVFGWASTITSVKFMSGVQYLYCVVG